MLVIIFIHSIFRISILKLHPPKSLLTSEQRFLFSISFNHCEISVDMILEIEWEFFARDPFFSPKLFVKE